MNEWSPPELPPHIPLVGTHVRLEPLCEAHLPGLAAVLARRETFAGGWGGGTAAATTDPEEFAVLVRRTSMAQQRPYAVLLADGRVVGTSTLGEFEPARERLHLGWTAYAPQAWGTVVNPETKLLLLRHVFDHGWGRVRLQTDVLNRRSRAAISKLGARFEGITRRDQRRADGTWRDAAVHAITIDDWPQVRVGLEQRVRDWQPDLSLWADIPPTP